MLELSLFLCGKMLDAEKMKEPPEELYRTGTGGTGSGVESARDAYDTGEAESRGP